MKLILGWAVGFVAAIGLAGCGANGGSQQPASVPLGKEFRIQEGQTVIVASENLQITLVSVVEDSRCPSDVQCIQAGQATIRLKLSPSTDMEMAVSLTLGGSGQAQSSASVGHYSIELRGLDPYPKTTVQVRPGDVVATLIVMKQ